MTGINQEYFPYSSETELIIHHGFEVHNTLGFGFREIVYKDALEYEFDSNGIPFSREEEYIVRYKDTVLKHKFQADFIVFDSVVLEVKAKEDFARDDLAQIINYLKCSGCAVGLILNFGRAKLQIKRLVF